MTNIIKNIIKESLDKLAFEKSLEFLSEKTKDEIIVESLNENVTHNIHPFERRMGRIAVVNRIRNGSLQMNKRVDVMGKGYKLMPTGQVIKMQPREILNRKRAAKRAARKRQLKMAMIVRKRIRSLQRRKSELGYFK